MTIKSLAQLCVDKSLQLIKTNVRNGSITMYHINLYYNIYSRKHLWNTLNLKSSVFEYMYDLIRQNERYYNPSIVNLTYNVDMFNLAIENESLPDTLFDMYEDNLVNKEGYSWYPAKKYIDDLNKKCNNKTIKFVISLLEDDNFIKLYEDYIYLFGIENMNMDIHDKYCYIKFKTLDDANAEVIYNNIVFLEYVMINHNKKIVNRDKMTKIITNIVDYASKYGYINTLNWFKERHQELVYTENAISYANENGRKDILLWWQESGMTLKYTEKAIAVAAKNGYTHVLEWWLNSGLEIKYNDSLLIETISNNKKYVLKWLMNNKDKFKFSKIKVLDFFRSKKKTKTYYLWLDANDLR